MTTVSETFALYVKAVIISTMKTAIHAEITASPLRTVVPAVTQLPDDACMGVRKDGMVLNVTSAAHYLNVTSVNILR